MILFVVESPGKIPAFQRAFPGCAVVATCGHFAHNPKRLWPIGIDDKFRETSRRADPAIVSLLRQAGQQAEEIVLALDDDDEGHAIALDAYQAIADIGRRIRRMRSPGMDPDTLTAAYEARVPFDPEDARPAVARRIVDRLIGAALSLPGRGLGRISSAVLGMLSRHDDQQVIGVLPLRLPATDGRGDWVCNVEVRVHEAALWRKRLQELKCLGAVDADPLLIPIPETPWNCRDALIHLARQQL